MDPGTADAAVVLDMYEAGGTGATASRAVERDGEEVAAAASWLRVWEVEDGKNEVSIE